VAVAKDVQRMVAHALEQFGRLDYAVNNAGVEGQFAGIVDLTEEDWDTVLDTNLRGTFLCLKYQATAMLNCGSGRAIVNVGSINSFLGFPSGSAYVASKHGLIGLTTSVSAELAPRGIRVNLICPGIIDTPMHHRVRQLLGDQVFDTGVLPSVHLPRRSSGGNRSVHCLLVLG
jgi:NAD(P)-dependent dehydrogenase (short-subunit alcohol dehydrogenase family)